MLADILRRVEFSSTLQALQETSSTLVLNSECFHFYHQYHKHPICSPSFRDNRVDILDLPSSTYPHRSPTESRYGIYHYRKLQSTNIHSLTNTETSLRHRHRDNPNARFIKNELRSLHLAPSPTSPPLQPSTEVLTACVAECDAFSGELLEIALDLKTISEDINKEMARAEEIDKDYQEGSDFVDGLKNIGLDLDDLKKDVRAVRDDMVDLVSLIEHHCGDVGFDVFGAGRN
ncbi:hypothetical protein BKA65DRAFT_481367 [Rhexocercosporidium sp. MPI-PUGE-AT-0058]|nr:hypothetical protein BKA65DRAFT_481367 [Rhexocercosporidium sp. MPI-PUGE-AT-0058]